jgi:ribosome assembly protein YihI (activator of Der GTPase)
MSIKEKLNEYKVVIGFTATVVGATVAVVAWANDQLKQQQVVIEAKAALIHNDYYQQGRIERKEFEIAEHERELDSLLEWLDGEELTSRQERKIEYLDDEIARLKSEIEAIRVLIATNNE